MRPRLGVGPFTTRGTSGAWTVSWPITNLSDEPIRLLTAQQPHSHFRTPLTQLDGELEPGAETTIALTVRFTELPGVIVENPFLVLTFRDRDDLRVLARIRVTAGSRGEPLAGESVVVTTQKVGRPD